MRYGYNQKRLTESDKQNLTWNSDKILDMGGRHCGKNTEEGMIKAKNAHFPV